MPVAIKLRENWRRFSCSTHEGILDSLGILQGICNDFGGTDEGLQDARTVSSVLVDEPEKFAPLRELDVRGDTLTLFAAEKIAQRIQKSTLLTSVLMGSCALKIELIEVLMNAMKSVKSLEKVSL